MNEALAFHVREASDDVAFGYIEALEQASAHIGRAPLTGSLCYPHELNLPGLRFRPLKRYPCLVFYIERSDQIDVWRVRHGERDMPQRMREGAAE